MGQARAEQALLALELLVGEWTVEARGPDGQAWPGAGRASFQWHPSHAHLIQRIAVDVPGAPDSTSVIGCDAANGTYIQLYSDERGVCRIYTMQIDSNQWILRREGEPFAQRFIGTISQDPYHLGPLGEGRERSGVHRRLLPHLPQSCAAWILNTAADPGGP